LLDTVVVVSGRNFPLNPSIHPSNYPSILFSPFEIKLPFD
jgi:hypothetical protein